MVNFPEIAVDRPKTRPKGFWSSASTPFGMPVLGQTRAIRAGVDQDKVVRLDTYEGFPVPAFRPHDPAFPEELEGGSSSRRVSPVAMNVPSFRPFFRVSMVE